MPGIKDVSEALRRQINSYLIDPLRFPPEFVSWVRKQPNVSTVASSTGSGPKKILFCWSGSLPTVIGNGIVWRVPFNSDGSSFTFTLSRAFARIEDTYTSGTSFRLEKSAGGNVAFSGSTITTLTVAAGAYEVEVTGLSTSVVSGDLVRIVFTSVGAVTKFDVELLGSQ